MIGWLLTSIRSESLLIPEKLLPYVSKINGLTIIYVKSTKFDKDSFLLIKENGITCTDGVLLNSEEMKAMYNFVSLPDFIMQAGMSNPISLIRQFRGPYSGFFHDYERKRTILFTNAMGDRPVYYYNRNGVQLAASDINILIDVCNVNRLPLTFNPDAARMILEYGFCVENCTMVKEITRLFPGSCLVWEGGKEYEIQYHMLNNMENVDLSERDAISELDRLFRRAVKRSFDKDEEYGYHHLADISAGMDSRMVNWVANDLGFSNVVNICYGITACIDERVSSRISSALGNEYYFRSLSDASFMLDLDETVRLSFGIAIYLGPTGSLRFMKALDTTRFGIRHNGNMGDTIFGAYLRSNTQKKVGDLSGHNYSSRRHGPYKIDFSRYENEEIQNLYARYLLADPVSHILVRDYTVAISPFMDVDFLDYFLKIPAKYRRGKLYTHWVNLKYPKATKYPYNSLIFTIQFNKHLRRLLTASIRKGLDTFQRMLYCVGLSRYRYRMHGMNPIGALYERSKTVKDFYTEYYQNSIGIFSENEEFQNILKDEFENGTPTEKALVLTVISCVKQHSLKVEGKTL